MFNFPYAPVQHFSAKIERELRDAFETALSLLKQGDDVALCSTSFEHKSNESVPPLNAVILVVGVPNTKEILTPVKEWMDEQNRKRMAKSIVVESAPPTKAPGKKRLGN